MEMTVTLYQIPKCHHPLSRRAYSTSSFPASFTMSPSGVTAGSAPSPRTPIMSRTSFFWQMPPSAIALAPY